MPLDHLIVQVQVLVIQIVEGPINEMVLGNDHSPDHPTVVLTVERALVERCCLLNACVLISLRVVVLEVRDADILTRTMYVSLPTGRGPAAAAPPKFKSNNPCRLFAAGNCHFGANCIYVHDKRAKPSASAPATPNARRTDNSPAPITD